MKIITNENMMTNIKNDEINGIKSTIAFSKMLTNMQKFLSYLINSRILETDPTKITT